MVLVFFSFDTVQLNEGFQLRECVVKYSQLSDEPGIFGQCLCTSSFSVVSLRIKSCCLYLSPLHCTRE